VCRASGPTSRRAGAGQPGAAVLAALVEVQAAGELAAAMLAAGRLVEVKRDAGTAGKVHRGWLCGDAGRETVGQHHSQGSRDPVERL
jgi:hypothetical protein